MANSALMANKPSTAGYLAIKFRRGNQPLTAIHFFFSLKEYYIIHLSSAAVGGGRPGGGGGGGGARSGIGGALPFGPTKHHVTSIKLC